MNLTPERIQTISDNFYNMFYDNPPATKEKGLSLVESMFNNFTALNEDLTQEEQNYIYKTVFRPLREEVLKAFATEEK